MVKKAKLGFEPLAAPGELLISTEKDLAKKEADKEYESWVKEKQRKLRHWHKKKHIYNARRRSAAQSVEKRYEAAERKAISRGEGWEFTPEEWEQAWMDAGWVVLPGSITTLTPQGRIVPAFALRGSNTNKHTSMHRVDYNKPWGPENTRILFRGEELKPGSRWWRAGPTG